MEGAVCIHTVVPRALGTSLSKPAQHLPSLLIKLKGAEGTVVDTSRARSSMVIQGDCRGWL